MKTFTCIQDNESIIHSLQYLTREAEKGGYAELHGILDAALNLASNKRKGISTGISQSQEAQNIIAFLVRYHRSSPAQKKRVLRGIEKIESLTKISLQ